MISISVMVALCGLKITSIILSSNDAAEIRSDADKK